jgi:hypothetical protein
MAAHPGFTARPPAAKVAKQLASYFVSLEAAFRAAGDRGGCTAATLNLAGQSVRLKLAGEPAVAAMLPALAHAAHTETVGLDFEVLVWDEASTGVPLPPPPWSWPSAASPVRLALPPGGEGYRIPATREVGSFAMFSLAARRAVVWLADATALPWHERAAPLKQVWQWWSAAVGPRIVHAGCVGTDAGATLLVGRGGSGKSTTAVFAAIAGLDYVSDDYCLLQPAAQPTAHALYATAKLHPVQLGQLPALPQAAVLRPSQAGEKAVVFLEKAATGRMALQLPVKSVIAPRVTGIDRPRLERLSPARALLALAPSTLMQLYRHAGTGCSDLAEIVRRLPCWRLELGGGLADIPDLLRQHLEAL